MGPAEDSTQASMKVKSYSTPRLAANRLKWITWKQQTFFSLMSNKGIQRHLEGMAQLLPAIPEYPDGHTLFTDEGEEVEKIEEKWDMYNQREATIRAQLLTTIPESQQRALGCSMCTLCEKHEKRALTVVVDLRRRLYVLKCLNDLNVKAHIQLLNAIHQQLKGMGEEISEKDFTTLILASLPKSYQPLINTISLHLPTKSCNP